jgi:mannose-6-phosphate isomerase-like protein (cupin superfamily)
MVQTNEPVAEHTHADGDEVIYVVAGEGTLRTGGKDLPITTSSLLTIPRGTTHSVVRRGSRPLVFVSTVSGPLCQPGK